MLYYIQKVGDMMEEKRKFPRWLLITIVAAAVCFAIGLWYDQLCYGEIDISESGPSLEMMCHIAEHVDELAKREDLFDVTVNDSETLLYYAGDQVDYFTIIVSSDTAERLRNGTDDFLIAKGAYWREDHSDFWDIVTPWSSISKSFDFLTKTMSLNVHESPAPDTSDAPLREAMSIIESIIGTP